VESPWLQKLVLSGLIAIALVVFANVADEDLRDSLGFGIILVSVLIFIWIGLL